MKRKLFSLLCHLQSAIIVLAFLSCSDNEQFLTLPSDLFDELNELRINKTGLGVVNSLRYNDSYKSAQGMAIASGIMYRLYDSGLCQSFDLLDINNPKPLSIFRLGSYQKDNHGNSAQVFIDEGRLFLYVAGLNKKCYVELIEKDSSKLVQTISVLLKNHTSDLNIICGDDGAIWAFGGMIPNGKFSVMKFRRPNLAEGDVTLTEKDMLEEWIIDNNYCYLDNVWQGGKVYNGQLFCVFGSSSIGKKVVIYDTISRQTIREFVIDDTIAEEPEDCDLYDGKLILVVNGGEGYYIID